MRAGGLVILRIVEICRWEASDVGNGSDDGLSAVALVGMDGFAVTAHLHRDGELWLAVETTAGSGVVPGVWGPRRQATAGGGCWCGTSRSPGCRRCWCGRSAPGAAARQRVRVGRGRRRHRTSRHGRR